MMYARQQPPRVHDSRSRVGGVRTVPALLAVVALMLVSVFGALRPASAGVHVITFDAEPNPIEFGDVTIGEWSTPETLTLSLTYDYPWPSFEVVSIDLNGLPIQVSSDACTANLVRTCEMAFQVRPDTAGPTEGVISITYDYDDGFVTRKVEPVTVRWEGIPEIAPPLVSSNQVPVGGITLSLTDGRGYGALVWAFDPDDGLPTLMRMHIPGVVTRDTYWNYHWADMPRYTGVNRHEAMVFLAQLPPGEHNICFDAMDNQTGQWQQIGCRTHVVK